MEIKKLYARALVCLLALIFALPAAGCTNVHEPDNSKIEAAIRASLADEKAPPELDFENMLVPMRLLGKANIVICTKDKTLMRNYAVAYDWKTRSFAVTHIMTRRLCENGEYKSVPNDLTLAFTEYAELPPFYSDSDASYLLFYCGEGSNLSEIRKHFESERLHSISDKELSEFEICDLKGGTLILLVPRYKGLSVWINEIEYSDCAAASGKEAARFTDKPVYIFCDFDDKLPQYEIHIAFDTDGEFFLTRKELADRLRKAAEN